MINNLIQTLYNLVDGIWVSGLSSVHFAATAFVFPVNFLFISIGMGISVAGTSILSQLVGADKEAEAREYAAQLIAISIILSFGFTIFGVVFTPLIVKAMGGTGDLAAYSITYLRITFLDLPFLFIFYNINSIRNAQGDTVTPTILSGIAAVINMILDPIFIFVFGWGIAGAAWATLVSRALLSIYGIKLILSIDNQLRPEFKDFKFDLRKLKELSRVGFPAAIGQSGAAFGFIILNGFIVSYGTATMAAFGMVNRITSLIMQPAMGIGAALTAVIGQNIGAGFYDRVKESFKKASILTVTFGTVGGLIMFVFRDPIVNFFILSKDDPDVIIQGIVYLGFISFSTPLMGMFSVFQGVFQGSGYTKYSMSMEIGRLWFVRIPMILIFKNFTNIGSLGIWISMVFSNIMAVSYGYLIYRIGNWNQRRFT